LVLILAGCGVYSGSFTRELVEALDVADIVYVDLYTMPSALWVLEALGRWAGKVKIAGRELLEEQSRLIVEDARAGNVVVLSAGDPLVATTHQTLLAEAARLGVEFRYIPGISGVCAAKSYSGLSYYRFGKIATIPGSWRGLKPYSVVAVIYSNLCVDAHPLLLLDVDDRGAQLKPRDALLELLVVEEELSKTLGFKRVLGETPILVVERAGAPDARVQVYDSATHLLGSREDARIPSSLVIPAPLNMTEMWVLESRLKVKLGITWSRRVYERVECCRAYEAVVGWLSSSTH
jgi:diphthine synthase